jgi:DNA-binding ferritin-like protein
MVYIRKQSTMNNILDFYSFINESDEFEEIELFFDKTGTNLERANLKLKGTSSGQMTKLINEYVRTHEVYEKAQEEYEKVKKNLKDSINEKFEINHQFITRTIETMKFVITFSKSVKEKRADVVDYQAVVEKLVEIFPEIREGLEDIKKACTEANKLISPGRSGSIKHSHIKMNEGMISSIKGILTKIKGIFSDLSNSLKKREKKIASHLKKVNKLLTA